MFLADIVTKGFVKLTLPEVVVEKSLSISTECFITDFELTEDNWRSALEANKYVETESADRPCVVIDESVMPDPVPRYLTIFCYDKAEDKNLFFSAGYPILRHGLK